MTYEPFKALSHADASELLGSLGGMSVLTYDMKRHVYARKELSLVVQEHGLYDDFVVFAAIFHARENMSPQLYDELVDLDDEMSRGALNMWRHHFLSQAFTGEILFRLVADKEKQQLSDKYQEELNARFIKVLNKLADKKFSSKVGDIIWVSYQGKNVERNEVRQTEIFRIPRL